MEMNTETFRIELQELNEDCLRHIFQYLSFEDKLRFFKVCSKWIQVSPSFWRISQFGLFNLAELRNYEYPDLMPNKKLNFAEFREIILNTGPTFQKLHIWLCDRLKGSIELVYSFDGTAYHLDGEFSYEAALDILVEACHDLKTLEIYAREDHPHLSEKFHALFLANEELAEVHLDCDAQAVLCNIIRLKDVPGPAKVLYLGLDTSKFLVDTNVDIICDLLESGRVNLKKLTFGFKHSIHASRLLQTVAKYAKGFQVLEISDESVQEPLLRMDELSALGDLEELSICCNMNLTNEVIYAIKDGCRKLKKVDLQYCSAIGNEGINTLMTSLPDLVSVSLYNLDISSILPSNAQWTSNLQTLEIHACDYIFRDEWKKIATFANLEELCIHESHDVEDAVTDEVISVVTAGCRKLRKITLIDCQQITNDGINTIMTRLQNLESVALNSRRVSSILNNDVQSSVKSLELSCGHLSEDALTKISLFKNLEVLYMNSMQGVTDEVLSAISLACQKLKTVILLGCSSVTGRGINSIVSALPNLEALELLELNLGSIFLEDSQESNLQRLVITNDKSFSHREFKTFLSKMTKLKYIHTRGIA